MAIGAFLPLVSFVVILGIVGLRLVSLWRRTREVPELSLGLGLLALAASMPLSAAGRMPVLAMQLPGRISFAAALAVIWLGISLMVFFNYRVFRHDSRWGFAAFALLSTILAGAVLYMSAMNFAGESVAAIKTRMRPGTLMLLSAILLNFLWAALESFRYYGTLRRRLALGLADPVLTNRFLLWGVASAASCGLIGVIVACVTSGMTIMREPVPLIAISAAGTVMSASWYLAFFAPERYQQLLRDRSAPGS